MEKVMKNKITLLLIVVVLGSVLGGMAFTNQDVEPDSQELHTIMRLLMLDIHTINEGIYSQNFDLIETGAAKINEHAPLSDESRSLVMETLGDRMSQFGEFDNLVHNYADSIRDAAVAKDMGRVLEMYNIVEQGCVNCHAAFQDEIRQARLKQ
jgi:cytochrome c556